MEQLKWVRKDYEDKSLQDYVDGSKDLHNLNAQGDLGNAALLIVNLVIEIHLARQWSITALAAYYARRTHYSCYDDHNLTLRQDNTDQPVMSIPA